VLSEGAINFGSYRSCFFHEQLALAEVVRDVGRRRELTNCLLGKSNISNTIEVASF